MIYLLWRASVKSYIEENFENSETWESWLIWRDFFIANKSPALAATEAHEIISK